MKLRSSLSLMAGAAGTALLALVGVGAALSSCGPSTGPAKVLPEREGHAEGPPPRANGAPPESAGALAAAGTQPGAVAIVPSASAPGAAAAGRSPVLAALASRDAVDMRLLASVERQLKGDVPREVFELITLRERGASPAELSRFIDERLPQGLGLRMAVRTWLREVTGEPLGREPAPPPEATGAPLIPRLTRTPTR
ncbi:hypothetical protein WME79_06955 [Sorangium sp. So ce726]|uniref:hypothetical protein n=1 Tax=Sorangium sp. So ce726 TaxID=3133319 RepID=UPI003F5EEE44